jgi:WhiB family redox-sensing transcriptional regulator
MDQAACLRHDPELWFGSAPEQGKAKAICQSCPVIVDCRAHALLHDERIGVWGGLDQDQLEQIRARAPQRRRSRRG